MDKNTENELNSYFNAFNIEVPENFDVKSCLKNGYDISGTGLFRSLAEIDRYKNKDDYNTKILLSQVFDFLTSALLLQEGLKKERMTDTFTHYMIPCAFCCRHAIELCLKYCALEKGIFYKKLICHRLIDLWNILDVKMIPYYDEFTSYIEELDYIDANSMALRYGLNTEFEITEEDFQFNVDIMIDNAKYLIGVLEKFFVNKES